MNGKRVVLIVLAALLLGGCSTYKAIREANIGSDFEKDSRAYAQLVRWHEMESAMAAFVSAPLRNDFRKRIAAAGQVQVVDYRIKSLACDPVRGEGTLTVEFDYYRLPSARVLTVVDNQKWAYEQIDGERAWRLQTLLPEFK